MTNNTNNNTIFVMAAIIKLMLMNKMIIITFNCIFVLISIISCGSERQTERQRDFHKERSNRSVINMLIIWGYLGESVNGQSVVYFEPLTMIFLWIKSGVWRYG